MKISAIKNIDGGAQKKRKILKVEEVLVEEIVFFLIRNVKDLHMSKMINYWFIVPIKCVY